MPKDVLELRKEYESIQVPEELDLYVEQAIRKGRRVKRTRRIFQPIAAIIFVFLVFAVSVNLSPAFASYVSALGMEPLVKLVSFDTGLANIVERGYDQHIGKSVTDKGITVTVEEAIFDGRKLVLVLRADTDRELTPVFIHGEIKGQISSVIWPAHEYNDSGKSFYQYLEIDIDPGQFNGEVIFLCKEIETNHGLFNTKTLRGDWSMAFRVDTELAELPSESFAVDETVSLGPVQFTVESVEVHPTVTDVKISIPRENPLRIISFNNARLIDEDGHVYKFLSALGPSYKEEGASESVLSFESTYFSAAKDLTLALDGVYTLPWEKTYLTIDIENGCIISDDGLGIEYLEKSFVEYPGEGGYLKVWFQFPKQEYVDSQFIWFDLTAYDLNGNPYAVQHGFRSGENKRFYISFDFSRGIPEVVKVEVIGISQGIMEPIRVPLQHE
jgi:hypothetical protein